MSDDRSESTRWQVHGERSIYESPWVRLNLVEVELPDGARFEHHVARLHHAAMVVVLDERDRVLLLWRHRFVFDRWGWELPGGLVDHGEDPGEAAAREAEEETGWRPSTLEKLVTFQPMVGMVDSEHSVFLTRDARWVEEPTETTEAQRIAWVPLASVLGLIEGGEIWNSGTLVGLLHLLATRGCGSAGSGGDTFDSASLPG